MSDYKMICPNCGEDCDRDEVDVGIGVMRGPWGCFCGWSEDSKYNALNGAGGWQKDGSYHDSRGGHWPKNNPVIKLMRAVLEGGKDE